MLTRKMFSLEPKIISLAKLLKTADNLVTLCFTSSRTLTRRRTATAAAYYVRPFLSTQRKVWNVSPPSGTAFQWICKRESLENH